MGKLLIVLNGMKSTACEKCEYENGYWCRPIDQKTAEFLQKECYCKSTFVVPLIFVFAQHVTVDMRH